MNWRESVLERDQRTCQFGTLFGVPELTGVPCNPELEVHHKTYRRFGHEADEDGITVCSRCHELLTDAIRKERYRANYDVEALLNYAIADAQRGLSRPLEPSSAEDEEDQWQTNEDRSGPPRARSAGVLGELIS